MIEFLLEAMQEEGKDRHGLEQHCAAKALAAQKQAEAAEKHTVAADKQATAMLIKSKAELLDRLIKCRELQIDVPAELIQMLKD